jgi:hypothetical protein
MRYLLTLDGVPVGHVCLSGSRRVAGHLEPLPAFESSGLAAVAARFGAALESRDLDRPRFGPTVRELATAFLEQYRWRARLDLRDDRGTSAAIGPITVVSFPDGPPLVVASLGLQGAGVAARRSPSSGAPGESGSPAV